MKQISLPIGSRDEYGSVLIRKRKIIAKISNYLEKNHFIPISTPLIEKKEAFSSFPEQNFYHMLDLDGEEIALRSDMTLPVARFIGATKLSEKMQKLYYVGDIFQQIESMSGQHNQQTQAGI